MPDKLTPEEKLLKLIENPNQDDKGLKIKRRLRKFSFNFLSLKQLKLKIKRLQTVKEKFKPYLANLKFVNRSIACLAILLIVFLIFDFIWGRPNMNNVYLFAKETQGMAQAIKPAPIENVVNLSDYQSLIAKRDVFRFTPLKKEVPVVQAKDILMAEVAQLKLVGIIWSKNPQAMIEDKRENKTVLVNQGDMMGKIKIKQILRDKVVVGYENEEFELL
jgi:type II secretory pathway component PulC